MPATPGNIKVQIAREIFVNTMTAMKAQLRLGELKYAPEIGDSNEVKIHKDSAYKLFKSYTMDSFWGLLEDNFDKLYDQGLIDECGCGYTIEQRNGYKSTCQHCYGCGFKNSDNLNGLLYQLSG